MLEDLLSSGPAGLVLCLLGFAATDSSSITLSAADATAHLVENPFTPQWLDHLMLITLLPLFVLGVFLRGWRPSAGGGAGVAYPARTSWSRRQPALHLGAPNCSPTGGPLLRAAREPRDDAADGDAAVPKAGLASSGFETVSP
jgi:hypothetical protein